MQNNLLTKATITLGIFILLFFWAITTVNAAPVVGIVPTGTLISISPEGILVADKLKGTDKFSKFVERSWEKDSYFNVSITLSPVYVRVVRVIRLPEGKIILGVMSTKGKLFFLMSPYIKKIPTV
jgi:hypothetical protein